MSKLIDIPGMEKSGSTLKPAKIDGAEMVSAQR